MDKKLKDALLEELEDDLSDAEMDQLLVERHDEIQALLDEAREDIAAGRVSELEPIQEFLRKARERRTRA